MPFRCNKCNVLSATEDNNNCSGGCDLVRVAVIHFLSPEGFGKVLCSGRKRDPDNENKEIKTLLKLGCESATASPSATQYYPAVTCLACRNNFQPAPKVPVE